MTGTYDELVDAWKRESHSAELQPLRQGFFKELSSYIRRLREAQRNLDPKSLKAVVMDEEMSRIDQLLAQLLSRRLDKLWSQPRTVQTVEIESVERQAREELSRILTGYEQMKQDLMQGHEPPRSRSSNGKLTLVRFERDVPSIIGVDLKTHGPFRKEDVATLPRENAGSLVQQGAAVEIRAPDQDNG
jgi:DNA replication initiation complex subunit (GINS family)